MDSNVERRHKLVQKPEGIEVNGRRVLVAPKLSWDRGLQHPTLLSCAVSHDVVFRALGVIRGSRSVLFEKSRRAPLWGHFDKQPAPRLRSLPRALNLSQSRAPESPDFGQRHARLRATSRGLLRLPVLLQIRFRRSVRVVPCLARYVVCPFPEIFRHLLNSTYQNRRWCNPYSRGKTGLKTAGQAVTAAAQQARCRSSGRPAAEMNEMPVVRVAIAARILAHR